MNTFGHTFRLSLFGESHGPGIGLVIDGLPAGISLSEGDFEADLARRRGGQRGTTPRIEADRPTLLSGLYEGHTTGAPLTLWFPNDNTRSHDYEALQGHYRPSHADFVAHEKFSGWNDPRGGGSFSGRLTVGLVAAGVVAKRLLPELTFHTSLSAVGGESDPEKIDRLLAETLAAGDSVGGEVECRIAGCPTGWGEPWFDSLESLAAHLLYAIPGVRGVAFGEGFAAASMRGSAHNDPLLNGAGTTQTNHAGGVVGGLTNGNEVVVRVAFKPTASIALPQMTYNALSGRVEELRIEGRHDGCIALRGAVVVEAAMAVILADLKLRNQK